MKFFSSTSTTQANAPIFHSRFLFWSAVLSFLFPLIGGAFLTGAMTAEQPFVKFLKDYPLVPVWIAMALLAAYYLHLAFFRFRFALLPFILVMHAWGALGGFTWAHAGWEAALTVYLATAGLTGFAFTWEESIARFLNVTGTGKRVGLFLLAILFPAAVLGLIAGTKAHWLSKLFMDERILFISLAWGVVSLGLLSFMAILTLKARDAAKTVLTSSSQ